MQYLLMICNDEKALAAQDPAESEKMLAGYGVFGEEMTKRGVLRDGNRLRPTADATIALISKYTGEAPERTRLSIAYAPPDGGLDFADIVRQVDWFKSQGMLKGEVDGNAIIDKRYAIDLPVQ